MRRASLVIGTVIVAAACSGTGADPATTTTTTDSTGMTKVSTTTTTTSPPDQPTTTVGPAATTTTTVLENAGAVCSHYDDYVTAGQPREAAAALRDLSIAVGFPRSDDLMSALDVLRARSSDVTEAAARQVLDEAFLEPCAAVPAGAGPDGFGAGILVGGPNGVSRLDGTPVVPADPAGTYLAAFDDREGGVFTLIEIRGLEIVDHRSGTAAVPRDLVLSEDAQLHDSGRFGGVDVAVATVWEAESEETGLAQFLYLLPSDGADPFPLARVGNLLATVETVSHAAGRYLITESELGGRATIYPLDESGLRIDDLPGLPVVLDTGFDDERQALQFARFAPDGASFAYLRVRPSAGTGASGELVTDVVLQRLSDGVEFMSIEIGRPGDLFRSLDFDGRFVIVATGERLFVVDTWADEGPDLSTVPLVDAEFAFFLESGIAGAGDG